MVIAYFCLENLTMNFFGSLISNQRQSSMLEESISKSSFWTTWELYISVLKFSLTLRGHLVLNIPFWSTDSYFGTIVLTKKIAPSILSWLVWRRKVLTAFSHNFAWVQIFFYSCLPRWNQTYSGITGQSNYSVFRFFRLLDYSCYRAVSDSDTVIKKQV